MFTCLIVIDTLHFSRYIQNFNSTPIFSSITVLIKMNISLRPELYKAFDWTVTEVIFFPKSTGFLFWRTHCGYIPS